MSTRSNFAALAVAAWALTLGLNTAVEAQPPAFVPLRPDVMEHIKSSLSPGVEAPITSSQIRRLGRRIVNLNRGVLDFAQSKLGQQVGRGECWDLANEALIAAGAQPANGYTFGTVVTQPIPGDIIQFYNARFESNGSWHQMGSPHHTAIIEKVQGNTITMLHQNVNGNRTVQRMTLDLSTKTSGSYTFYRPMHK
jgi:hypothetical protein